MFAATLLSVVLLAQAPMAAPAPQGVLETGPCLDSRPVPAVLQPPLIRSNQIVRIDKVESTATMMPGEIIAFLYTLQDGSTWLGQRDEQYMSGASAAQSNQVLGSTHMPGQNVDKFPPQMKHGVATKYPQFFKVSIPPTAFEGLRITLAPCVMWPAGRALPDPNM